ncbi:hypothetical protein BSLG_008980 [Batrachochytrium salamandrivorans]|nr:hypothetical protein BSLG_008980 [Batrachochytrium salamandrivorans]
MDSNCTPFSVDDLSDDHELDLIQLQHGEVQEAVIQTTKRGKPISSIWNLFTDAIDAHQVSSGNNCICKHSDSVLNAIVSQRDFEGNGTTKQKQQKRFIKEIITSVDFLDYLKISIKILEPIDMFITMFQSDSVPISEVYQAFIKLPNIFSEIVGISLEQKDLPIKLTAERLNFIYGDAHGFGNILDPRYLGDGMDRELRSQVEDLLFAFGPDESTERKEKIYNKYTKFRVSALQENC